MYIIKKTDAKIQNIYDKEWEKAQVAEVTLDSWPEERVSDYMPNTTARILYSDYGIHIRLETDEAPLFAKRREQNSDVCEDSCMEFFFRPNEADPRYLNFEFNPLGTMYLGVRTSRYDFFLPDVDKYFFEVQSVVDASKWVLQFVVPFEYIDSIFDNHTKNMFGNLHKCCGNKETKHRASYYPIKTEKPDFHAPEYFGEFVLE